MAKIKLLIRVIIFMFLSTSGFAQANKQIEVACIGFYNLENLFDTIDNPAVRDTEFTPMGRKNWDSKKYMEKLQNLSFVINDLGAETSPDGCAILGICEVENRKVVEDLVKEKKIANRNYQIAHIDSPDKRGIDVGLLYQEKYFKPAHIRSHPLIFKDNLDYKTRNQLVVTGSLLGEEISLIVCHWPSRFGGQAASEIRRIQAAKLGRHIIDSLFKVNHQAKIILMGDLNDDPVNKSIKQYLQAKSKTTKVKANMLYNPMYDLYKKGLGTLAWGDAWNLFDQVLLSYAFLGSDYTTFKYFKVAVLRKPYLFQTAGRYKGYPKRTTAGGKYLGGYSDHLPVYITLVRKVAS
ncbi:endonuclease/exonuclease/phosphatase family protein [Putridiphycobacter roseus]|uniref:Endonuclease/exonuclease/phosphatase family protein n=1 Tax=Putridiphycobacter roseus TaxID=2219161 RepID=A0A2W1NHA3_9FLAO|nr:endonuclease/exonuclease/phosphatase family protein [Putridiphycobacter roseus]PZE17376.1 endonuclease/exonuclease/phosphatase family protein [Putridiphycobacter roseus]